MDAPAAINFFKGHPAFRLLPNKEILEATTELLTPATRPYDADTENRHPLTYGSDLGALWVREQIARFNNEKIFHVNHTKPEFLNLTSGASYGILNVLLQTSLPHTGYTKQAFIVTPTYFLINDCFIDAGFGGKLTAIDETMGDEYDLNLELLETNLKSFAEEEDEKESISCIQRDKIGVENKKIYRFVMYCVPTFSNPSGNTYSLKTKLKLIELARRYDMLIISDDVYDLLDYEQFLDVLPHVPKRFVHLDRETSTHPENSFGNTLSNATFSKIIAPGLRFGYTESISNKLVLQLSRGGANTSGGTPSQLNSMIVGTMLKNGLVDKVLHNLRQTYKERSVVMYESIKRWLPRKTQCQLQKGGYFTWITLPLGYDAVEIGKMLNDKYQVVLANGSNFEVIGNERKWGERSVRLSISFLETQDIRAGIKAWGSVCQEYASEHGLIF